MGSEYIGPVPDPHLPPQHTTPSAQNEDTQPQEPAYREHVTGGLVVHPADAPYFRPAYVPEHIQYIQPGASQAAPGPIPPPYQGAPGLSSQPGQVYPTPGAAYYPYPPNGYYPYPPYQHGNYPVPAYNGYPPYPYPYYYGYPAQPPGPKRDGYLLGISITSFICAILVLLGGVISLLLLTLITLLPASQTVSKAQLFSSNVLFTALGVAGLVGGFFCLYHSIRSLFLKKPSGEFRLPWFWVFLVIYVALLVLAGFMTASGNAVSNIPLTILLIALAGILPALTVLALALRHLHFPRNAPWPTNWRRFTLALVSGATSAIVLASIFELILTAVLARSLGLTNIAIDNPDLQIPTNPRMIAFLLVLVSVIAPLVEETVKPLAVVVLIGRVRSAAEAFILGMSCGIGFDLIETSGYISMGYKDWLDVALQRSTAGLLHGLGAGMVALGWYILTHPKERKHAVLLALGCWTYAVLQHALWNGSFVLQLLPAPVGPYLSNGTIPLGPVALPSFILVYIVASALMLAFLLFVTGKLRGKTSTSTPSIGTTSERGTPPAPGNVKIQHVGVGR